MWHRSNNARRDANLCVNPHPHTGALRGLLRAWGQPHGFHRGLNAGWHPAGAGCMEKQAVLASANRVSMHNPPMPQSNARCSTTPAAYYHARIPTTHAPRLARGAALHQAHGENRGGNHACPLTNGTPPNGGVDSGSVCIPTTPVCTNHCILISPSTKFLWVTCGGRRYFVQQ